MNYAIQKYTAELETVDIHTMRLMGIDDYLDYLKSSLIYVDPHDNLRASQAGFPIACTREQMSALIDYLTELSNRVGSEMA